MTIRSDFYGFTAQQVYQLNQFMNQWMIDRGLGSLTTYAEGTFTPTIVGATTPGAGTYTVQQGNYTKIGNRVFFNLVLVWTATTGTGNMLIGGMPFTSNVTANSNSGQPIGFFDNAGAFDSYFVRIGNSSTQLIVHTHVSGVGIANLAIPASGNINVSGSYLV